MVTHSYKRSDRISKLLHIEISKIIQKLKDPRLEFVTVTDLELTNDLSEAKVFFSVVGSEQKTSDIVDILNKASGFIKHQLYEKVCLREIPKLRFIYDDTSERAVRIFSILDKLAQEKKNEKSKKEKI
ncbi:MAG: 30S ribosome-binding factor RbfA [Endomicrobiia bacterium]